MFGSGISGGVAGVRALRRGIADFVLALLLFWGVAFLVGHGDMRAHAVPLSVLTRQSIDGELRSAGQPRLGAMHGRADNVVRPQASGRPADLALLSVAFAALVAGNLAFWRHLRRVYASPRRNVWRRG
jgi:hypothetical protein